MSGPPGDRAAWRATPRGNRVRRQPAGAPTRRTRSARPAAFRGVVGAGRPTNHGGGGERQPPFPPPVSALPRPPTGTAWLRGSWEGCSTARGADSLPAPLAGAGDSGGGGGMRYAASVTDRLGSRRPPDGVTAPPPPPFPLPAPYLRRAAGHRSDLPPQSEM